MNRAERIAAFRFYLSVGDGDVSDVRDGFEADPDATLSGLEGAGLWPDVLWSIVQTLAARVIDETENGRIWAERWSEQADLSLRDLRARHDAMKAGAETRARLEHVTGARTRGRQRKTAGNKAEALRLQAAGKSIAYTAEKLGLHPTTVARYRGEARKEAP